MQQARGVDQEQGRLCEVGAGCAYVCCGGGGGGLRVAALAWGMWRGGPQARCQFSAARDSNCALEHAVLPAPEPGTPCASHPRPPPAGCAEAGGDASTCLRRG